MYSNGSAVVNLPEIEALYLDTSPSFKIIPNGIKDKFINLKALTISTGLESVNYDNFKQFGNSLETLDLTFNSITNIDKSLFDFNPNLKNIDLSENPIERIDPGFFVNLIILKNLET